MNEIIQKFELIKELNFYLTPNIVKNCKSESIRRKMVINKEHVKFLEEALGRSEPLHLLLPLLAFFSSPQKTLDILKNLVDRIFKPKDYYGIHSSTINSNQILDNYLNAKDLLMLENLANNPLMLEQVPEQNLLVIDIVYEQIFEYDLQLDLKQEEQDLVSDFKIDKLQYSESEAMCEKFHLESMGICVEEFEEMQKQESEFIKAINQIMSLDENVEKLPHLNKLTHNGVKENQNLIIDQFVNLQVSIANKIRNTIYHIKTDQTIGSTINLSIITICDDFSSMKDQLYAIFELKEIFKVTKLKNRQRRKNVLTGIEKNMNFGDQHRDEFVQFYLEKNISIIDVKAEVFVTTTAQFEYYIFHELRESILVGLSKAQELNYLFKVDNKLYEDQYQYLIPILNKNMIIQRKQYDTGLITENQFTIQDLVSLKKFKTVEKSQCIGTFANYLIVERQKSDQKPVLKNNHIQYTNEDNKEYQFWDQLMDEWAEWPNKSGNYLELINYGNDKLYFKHEDAIFVQDNFMREISYHIFDQANSIILQVNENIVMFFNRKDYNTIQFFDIILKEQIFQKIKLNNPNILRNQKKNKFLNPIDGVQIVSQGDKIEAQGKQTSNTLGLVSSLSFFNQAVANEELVKIASLHKVEDSDVKCINDRMLFIHNTNSLCIIDLTKLINSKTGQVLRKVQFEDGLDDFEFGVQTYEDNLEEYWLLGYKSGDMKNGSSFDVKKYTYNKIQFQTSNAQDETK